MLLKDSQLKKLIKKTKQQVEKKKKPVTTQVDASPPSEVFREMQKRPFSE